jgi:hypothetical protein
VSYIVARKVEQAESDADTDGFEHGFRIEPIDFEARGLNALDNNLDDEILSFVLDLIKQVDDLAEGEALVIWKEIF